MARVQLPVANSFQMGDTVQTWAFSKTVRTAAGMQGLMVLVQV
jgi:hypothetical protein